MFVALLLCGKQALLCELRCAARPPETRPRRDWGLLCYKEISCFLQLESATFVTGLMGSDVIGVDASFLYVKRNLLTAEEEENSGRRTCK